VLRFARGENFSDSEEERPKKQRRRLEPGESDGPNLLVDTGSWSDAEKQALRAALRVARPNVPGYWDHVAEHVGRSAEECQEFALGTLKKSWSLDKERGAPLVLEQPETPQEPVVFAKKDGPCRAKQLRAFVSAQSFCAGHDFLVGKMPLQASTQTGEAAAVNTPKQALPSSAVRFLKTLHIGTTPPDARGGKIRPVALFSPDVREKFATNDEDDDANVSCALGDLGASWRPNGIEAYVCEMRDKRKQAAKHAARNLRHEGLTAVPADKDRAELSKVSGLLRHGEEASRREAAKYEESVLEDGPLAYWSEEEDQEE